MTNDADDLTSNRRGWHLERTINVGMIAGFVLNAMIGAWYAAKLDARLVAVEAWQQSRGADHEMLVRIDERTRTMADDITSLKRHPSLPPVR